MGTTTASLIRGGDEDDDGGPVYCCWESSCTTHNGDANGCREQEGCYYYPHFFSQGDFGGAPNVGSCLSCSGVSCGYVYHGGYCGQHRSPDCSRCHIYNGKNKGSDYCNGEVECNWQVDKLGGYCANSHSR